MGEALETLGAAIRGPLPVRFEKRADLVGHPRLAASLSHRGFVDRFGCRPPGRPPTGKTVHPP